MRQLKADLRKAKKENIKILESNKELIHSIAKKRSKNYDD